MKSESTINIRKYQIQDLSPLVRVFTESVHELTATAYDETQRFAWASRMPQLDSWQQRLESLETLVAEEGEELAGFISYDQEGHIDLIFTAPDYARQGIASALYRKAEQNLAELGVTELYTEASVVARPFFESHGFHVKEEQRVTIRGNHLLRYVMGKSLKKS